MGQWLFHIWADHRIWQDQWRPLPQLFVLPAHPWLIEGEVQSIVQAVSRRLPRDRRCQSRPLATSSQVLSESMRYFHKVDPALGREAWAWLSTMSAIEGRMLDQEVGSPVVRQQRAIVSTMARGMRT